MSTHIYRTEKSQIKYQGHYDKLIARAQLRADNRNLANTILGYCEKHHIIPYCVGGTDTFDNYVYLTPEEHYIAHQLLVFIYPNNRGILNACILMCTDKTGNRVNNKLFGWLKRQFSEVQKSENKHNSERVRKQSETMSGRSKETHAGVAAQSQKMTGRRKETHEGLARRSEKIRKINDEQRKLIVDLKNSGISNKEILRIMRTDYNLDIKYSTISSVYQRDNTLVIPPKIKKIKEIKPPKKGRTKETHPGIARQAEKMTGRTKENHEGVARMAMKQTGKTKENNAGVARQSAKLTGRNKNNHEGVAAAAESKNRISLSLRTELFQRHLNGELTKNLFIEIEPLQIPKVTYQYLLYLFRRMKKELKQSQ